MITSVANGRYDFYYRPFNVSRNGTFLQYALANSPGARPLLGRDLAGFTRTLPYFTEPR